MRVPKQVKVEGTMLADNSGVKLLKEIDEETIKKFFHHVFELTLEIINQKGLSQVRFSELKIDVFEWEEIEKRAIRVTVRSGDGSEDYGLGSYIDNVPVYLFQMPDGSIQSLANPETKPTPEQYPVGGQLRQVENNPKIELDNPLPDGRKVVYGCQVWFQDIPEK